MPRGELICKGCGQYESECSCPREKEEMEAEDTVMNNETLRGYIRAHFADHREDIQSIAKAQAEISFKAGAEEERSRVINSGNELLKKFPEANKFWLVVVNKTIYGGTV